MSVPTSQFLIYQSEDGRIKLDVRFEGETVWRTQKVMAELFGKDVRTINEHIRNLFAERELAPDSVIRNFRITAADGKNYTVQRRRVSASSTWHALMNGELGRPFRAAGFSFRIPRALPWAIDCPFGASAPATRRATAMFRTQRPHLASACFSHILTA